MKSASLYVLLVALLVSPVASQVADDNLIVAGVRVGKWTLEMTIPDLVAMNGPQNGPGGRAIRSISASALGGVADFQTDITEHYWSRQGLVVGTRDGTKVLYLLAWQSPDFKTSEGIGWGVSPQPVEAAYGKPTTVTTPGPGFKTWIYDARGIALIVQDSGNAASIFVFNANSAKSIWKF